MVIYSAGFSGCHLGDVPGTTKSAPPRFRLRKKCEKLKIVQHHPKILLEEDAIVWWGQDYQCFRNLFCLRLQSAKPVQGLLWASAQIRVAC